MHSPKTLMMSRRLRLLVLCLLAPTGLLSSPAQTDLGVPSTGGLVVSSSGIAADIGAGILARGGNAVDAAVATAFAMAVTYPAAGNIGGGGFMIVRTPDGRATTFDYREMAPGKAAACRCRRPGRSAPGASEPVQPVRADALRPRAQIRLRYARSAGYARQKTIKASPVESTSPALVVIGEHAHQLTAEQR
jgi:hypothetical protein